MAPWHFVELASFGDVIAFYKYLAFDSNVEISNEERARAKKIKRLLFPTKTLRNAAAHNDCLLNGMRRRLKKPIGFIRTTLIEEYCLPSGVVNPSWRVPVVHDLSALLICLDSAVVSEGVKLSRSSELAELRERFGRNLEYYRAQPEILNCFNAFRTMFEAF